MAARIGFGLGTLLALLAVASAARDYAREERLALDPVRIALHNKNASSTWVAGENEFFKGMTFEDAKRLLGTRMPTDGSARDGEPTKTFDHIKDEDVPAAFDARAQWPNFIHPIRNQEMCGSCWAFGAVEALSDRFAIASNGSVNVILSPQDLVSCDELSLGCSGGLVNLAWRYLTKVGAVTDSCFPYTSGHGNVPPCPFPRWKECQGAPDANYFKYKTKNYYRLSTVADIQKAIMTGGPVEARFLVYQSFMTYRSGVYQRNWWDISDLIGGGHAVKIVGWGTESGVDYWLIANSWGPIWGLDGYFKIKRGVNECFIEETVYGGDPDL